MLTPAGRLSHGNLCPIKHVKTLEKYQCSKDFTEATEQVWLNNE